jgi:deazaflavin-dependent oxidoreductase (nitroreductase family)
MADTLERARRPMLSADVSSSNGSHHAKRKVSKFLAKRIVNPITRRLAGRVPWWALLETTGRRSGLPRRSPVGNGLRGDTFWIVAEHGSHADYVRNLMANPRVRVRVNGRWRTGTAVVMPDDDPRARQRSLSRFNSAVVRVAGTELLTVRIDLVTDTSPGSGPSSIGPVA